MLTNHIEPLEPNFLNRMLAMVAVLADITGIIGFIAQILSNNPLLILAIVATVGIFIWGYNWLMQHGWIDRLSILYWILICLGSIVFVIVIWAPLASTRVTPVGIEITTPQDGEKIEGHRYVIKGKVDDPDARIYVIVRPLEPLDYWVQDRPTIDSNGNWQVNAYFGDRNAGVDEDYEVIALATNENFLRTLATGNFLKIGRRDQLPANSNHSNFVTITRIR